MSTEKLAVKTGLSLLREPFASHLISKLPKPTKAQTDEVRADYKKGIRCGICGGWHHPNVVHLDYVGHAALTDRLLEADPSWNWEPLSVNEQGWPAIDNDGGMWIRLTICGVTRIGYGDADGKTGGNAVKERIGDALRNAAMRFGCALDLWHKGDLHGDDGGDEPNLEKKAIQHPQSKSATSPASVGKDANAAEAGEVAFIKAKIAALKVATLEDLLAEAGITTLDNLTKDGFDAMREALKGKK